ncbi:hypothetical protein AH06_01745 [candidate division TM6 bacterium Zodletone_IIa]|nr:hypothetical protein AH06_01745 [candidate division TM6 bacterium Zodletone_IIa]
MQLTLFHKALVLVAVPLTFELIFLTVLFSILNEFDRESRAAAHAKATIAQTNEVIQTFYNCSMAFVLFDTHSEDALRSNFNKYMRKAPVALQELKILVQGNQRESEIVERVEKQSSGAIEWLRATVVKSKAGEKLNFYEAMENQKTLDQVVKQLDEIIKLEKAQQSKTPTAAARRQIIEELLISGAVISVILAFLLVIIFHQGTTKRLKALIENSVRLGKGEELAPLLQGNDEIAAIDFTFHAAQNSLKQAAEKREELEKMKNQFVAMISHDLRTPMSAVITTLDLLGSGAWGELDGKGQSKVNNAKSNLRNSIELINDLLDLEKMESGTIKLDLNLVSIRKLVKNAIDSVASLAEQKQIKLITNEVEARVFADEHRLSRVLVNLLGNALKFSPENSSIEIIVHCDQKQAKVSISDHGPGVPDKHKDLIFDKFHQIPVEDKTKGGTGLGLAICKSIIEAHRGEIGVENLESGCGSRFWFSLPLPDS